jgi:hypothetical protein
MTPSPMHDRFASSMDTGKLDQAAGYNTSGVLSLVKIPLTKTVTALTQRSYGCSNHPHQTYIGLEMLQRRKTSWRDTLSNVLKWSRG